MLCAPCHGAKLEGYTADHAPSLINPTFIESATDAYLKHSIGGGRPGTSMAAYSTVFGGPLDEPAIDNLVAYIRGQGAAAKPLPVRKATGNADRGRGIYDSTCKSCHGDLATRGEAVQLANPNFLQEASDEFIRYAIALGRPGTKMEPFAGKLTDAQLDDVIAYVRALGGTEAAVKLLPEPTGKEPLILNPKGKAPTWTVKEDRFVSVDDVHKALVAKRRLVIIDARPPSEWMRVHAAGAVSIPYHDMKRLAEIPMDVDVVAYCACPHHLSGIVADELQKRGYAHALVLDEGILEWHRRGYPVVAAPGVTPPPAEPTVNITTSPR